jgi:DNA-binding MarR family transcriptional regulator
VVAAGGRAAASLDFSLAIERLSVQVSMDALLIDLESDHGFVLDRMLDRVDLVSARESVPVILSMTPDLIDTVTARISSPAVTLLCQPDSVDRVSALSCAWIDKPAMLNDISADLNSMRLKRLADEVNRIARALASLSGSGVSGIGGESAHVMQAHLKEMQTSFAAEPALLGEPEMPDPAEIRALLRLRRLRDNFFDPLLFADPAWDMLLDLMAARLEGDQVAVSSLCIAAAVPPTTALRWIKAMSDHGLFERHADPTDGRRIFIRLSDTATAAMARYFMAVKRFGGKIV